MSNDRGAPPPPPPPSSPEGSATPEQMAGGGIYFRWNDRLWQEQADGSYLVWDDEARRWSKSTVQPPAPEGQTIATRECPKCGRRVKSTLRYCPYCEYGFESRTAPAPAPTPVAAPKAKRDVSTLALVAALIVVIAAGIFVFQQRRAQACESWKAAVQELTDAKVELQGLPRGMTEEDLYEQNETLLADRRPGGCE